MKTAYILQSSRYAHLSRVIVLCRSRCQSCQGSRWFSIHPTAPCCSRWRGIAIGIWWSHASHWRWVCKSQKERTPTSSNGSYHYVYCLAQIFGMMSMGTLLYKSSSSLERMAWKRASRSGFAPKHCRSQLESTDGEFDDDIKGRDFALDVLITKHYYRYYFACFASLLTSRVIQKALDELSKRDIASLISTFKGNVLLCLNDHNGKILSITLAEDMAW